MVDVIIAAVALIVLVAVILWGTAYGGFESLKASLSFIKLFSVSIELKGPRREAKAGEHRKHRKSLPPA